MNNKTEDINYFFNESICTVADEEILPIEAWYQGNIQRLKESMGQQFEYFVLYVLKNLDQWRFTRNKCKSSIDLGLKDAEGCVFLTYVGNCSNRVALADFANSFKKNTNTFDEQFRGFKTARKIITSYYSKGSLVYAGNHYYVNPNAKEYFCFHYGMVEIIETVLMVEEVLPYGIVLSTRDGSITAALGWRRRDLVSFQWLTRSYRYDRYADCYNWAYRVGDYIHEEKIHFYYNFSAMSESQIEAA